MRDISGLVRNIHNMLNDLELNRNNVTRRAADIESEAQGNITSSDIGLRDARYTLRQCDDLSSKLYHVIVDAIRENSNIGNSLIEGFNTLEALIRKITSEEKRSRRIEQNTDNLWSDIQEVSSGISKRLEQFGGIHHQSIKLFLEMDKVCFQLSSHFDTMEYGFMAAAKALQELQNAGFQSLTIQRDGLAIDAHFMDALNREAKLSIKADEEANKYKRLVLNTEIVSDKIREKYEGDWQDVRVETEQAGKRLKQSRQKSEKLREKLKEQDLE